MSTQIEMSNVREMFRMYLVETFENVEKQPLFINRDTSIFPTLAGISAEQASQDMGNCATISAHVHHIRYYLDVIEDLMFKRDLSYVDWSTIWESVNTVSEDEWQSMVDNLKTSYERIKAHLNNDDVWNGQFELSCMMGMIVHSAYHLGELRQMLCRLDS